ncbi:hypothetical protein C922_02230 [Plasmodium inui San Antonio 1]|uniref:Uncharacterized protein n=1 Tax=Plasmodium inui San Antonio 1 TaxID=1237626 RepID=W7AEQ7_9APIC|nr:hypothetical protein C922_02230 [Plasmodium inui San Antonio 1]EUD67524.1 hypothetical protein C922_02230 [Plasmodium inui San Antonio 1]
MLKYFTKEHYSYLSSSKRMSFRVERDIKTRTTFVNREDLKHVFVLDSKDTTAGLCLLNISLFLLGGLSKERSKGELATNLQGGLFIISLIIFSIQKMLDRCILSDVIFALLLYISCVLPFLLLELNGCFNNILFFPICVIFYFTRYHLRTLFILDSFLILTILVINVSINTSTIDIYIFLFLLTALLFSMIFYRYLYYFSRALSNSVRSPRNMILIFPYINEYQQVCFAKLADVLLDSNNYMQTKWNIFCRNIPKIHIKSKKDFQSAQIVATRLANKFFTLRNQKLFSTYPPYYCLKVLYHKKLYLIISAIERKRKQIGKLHSNGNRNDFLFLMEMVKLHWGTTPLQDDSRHSRVNPPQSGKRPSQRGEKKKGKITIRKEAERGKEGNNRRGHNPHVERKPEYAPLKHSEEDNMNQNGKADVLKATEQAKGVKPEQAATSRGEHPPRCYNKNRDTHKKEAPPMKRAKSARRSNEKKDPLQKDPLQCQPKEAPKKEKNKRNSPKNNSANNSSTLFRKGPEKGRGNSAKTPHTKIDRLHIETPIGNLLSISENTNRAKRGYKRGNKNDVLGEAFFESKCETRAGGKSEQSREISPHHNIDAFKKNTKKTKAKGTHTDAKQNKKNPKNDVQGKRLKNKFAHQNEHGFEFFFTGRKKKMGHQMCDHSSADGGSPKRDDVNPNMDDVNPNMDDVNPNMDDVNPQLDDSQGGDNPNGAPLPGNTNEVDSQMRINLNSYLNDKMKTTPNAQSNYINMYMYMRRQDQDSGGKEQTSGNYPNEDTQKKKKKSEGNFSSSGKYHHDWSLLSDEKIIFVNFSCLFYVFIHKIKWLLKYIEKVNSVVQGGYFRQGISPKRDHLLAFLDQKVERYYILWSNSFDLVYHVENYIPHILLILTLHLSSVFVRVAPLQLSGSYSLFRVSSFSTIFAARFLLTPVVFALIFWPIVKTRSVNPRNIFKIKMHCFLLSLFILTLSTLDYLWTILLVQKNFWRLDGAVLAELQRTYSCSMFSLAELIFFAPVFYFLIMHRLKSLWYLYIIWLSLINVIYWSLIGTLVPGLKMNISLATSVVMCVLFIIRPFEMVKRDIFCRCVLPYILFLDDVLRTLDCEERLKYLRLAKIAE